MEALNGRMGYVHAGWNGGHTLHVFNLPQGWKVAQSFVDILGKGAKFADKNGEAREMRSGDFIKNVILRNCGSWDDYDQLLQAEELKTLKEAVERGKISREENYREIRSLDSKVDSFKELLKEIYDINQKAGPHSRKKVREILLRVVEPCEECENANCICE